MRTRLAALTLLLTLPQLAVAEIPTANYIFPAGGRRGTTVVARIGGCNLHDAPRLIWAGAGVSTPAVLSPTETIWFEGPVIPQPASQQKEDYPRDFAAQLQIVADAPAGRQTWRLTTSQGVTNSWGFVIGDFPEVVEQEVEGETPAVRVTLPTTINGRIFPREDVDAWSFLATKGQTITCRVATSEFGSPLDARTEVRNATGEILGEQSPEGNTTPDLRFVVPSDGEYQVRIHDIGFGGLQDHVYRLTVTSEPVIDSVYPLGGKRGSSVPLELKGGNLNQTTVTVTLPQADADFTFRLPIEQQAFGAVRLDLDDLTEVLEAEPNEQAVASFSVPAILNGRIQSAGDVDTWSFRAKKGMEYDFEVRAARLGSPLDAVLEITDAMGKRIVEADDSQGIQTDSRLRWTAPADEEYRVSIRDRLPSRGDARFSYRIRVVSAEIPEYSLATATDALILERGKTANVKVTLDRGPGFKEPVEVVLEGLPPGVTVSSPAAPFMIAAGQRELQLTLKAEAEARVAVGPVKITGRAKVNDKELIVRSTVQPPNPEQGRVAVADDLRLLWVAVAVPTPFKFLGIFETKFIPRGGVFVRKYHIDRNGYDGPLEVRLADKQGRHLQGVHASSVVVPAGQSDFEFAVNLPPWMEIGRTCRSTLAVVGKVSDSDGTQHTVSYSSNDQNNQMIALVDPGRFAVQLPRSTLSVKPGRTVELPIRLQRAPGLSKSVSIEVIASAPIQGVSAKPLEIAADATQGNLTLILADQLAGLSVHPIVLRATTKDERGLPVIAESSLQLIENK
ncbi:MAG: hypothetical protein U0941_21805 [Planctomycetaceae bacterium]